MRKVGAKALCFICTGSSSSSTLERGETTPEGGNTIVKILTGCEKWHFIKIVFLSHAITYK